MTTSGTYAYAPDIAEFCDEAWERCGKDPMALQQKHIVSARRSINLMFSDWAADDVHLFAIDEQSTPAMVAGTASYTVVTGTLALLTCFMRRDGIDTPVYRISRDEYAQIPDKTQRGLPTQAYHDRKAGTFSLWNVPENATDVFHYWRLRRLQDVTAAMETPDVPYRWFEALAAGLAARLAVKWAKDQVSLLEPLAERAFAKAKAGDRVRADVSFTIG